VRRREFIAGLGGASAWPLVARAQQQERIHRVGALMDTAEDSTAGRERVAAFVKSLRQLGWAEGHNLRLDVRWAAGDVERARVHAKELVASLPDAIFAFANAQLRPLSQETKTIPIIFVGASDPVGAGYVASFARPGGNITGFTLFEPLMAGKWVSALKDVSPTMARIALMLNPDTATLRGAFFADAFKTAASEFAVEPLDAFVKNVADLESSISELGQRPHSGLIVAPDTFTTANQKTIVALAARHRLPAIYGFREFPEAGGLMSYGSDQVDIARRAAAYVDRVLRGESPAELPIQAPTKFELVINLKTAKGLGLTIPAKLLFTAEDVIE
jgi:putative ABC transport system substrate-binding protein